MKIGLSNKLIFVQIYVPNLRKKWYTKGMKSLSEEEKYILALVEMDLDKLNDLGGENIMDEYVKEAEEVSFEGGVGEAYDKEWALRDQGYREGMSQGKSKEKIEIAKNLLKNNVDISVIASSTGLTEDEINSLK